MHPKRISNSIQFFFLYYVRKLLNIFFIAKSRFLSDYKKDFEYSNYFYSLLYFFNVPIKINGNLFQCTTEIS